MDFHLLRLWIIIMAAAISLTASGCNGSAKADNFSSIQKKLFELKSFKCTVEMNIYNNKNTTRYVVSQYYLHPGKSRVEVVSPEYLKGLTAVSNGRYVAVVNPDAGANNSYSADNLAVLTGNNTFLTEFFSNYVKSEDSKVSIKNNKYVLSTIISNGNAYMDRATLIVNPAGQPESLKILDGKGETKMTLIYKEFVANPKLDINLFESRGSII